MDKRRGRASALLGAALLAVALTAAPPSLAFGQAVGDGGQAPAAGADYRRGLQLFHSGRYDEALPYFVTAREEAAARHGTESTAYATALNNLAELYRLMERYDAAEPLFRQALSIEEARLGPNDPGLARPLNNLALLHRAQGRYDEAELKLKRSLALLEDSLGRRHPDVAGSLNNLARLYEAMGQGERALPLLERSLLIAEDTLGPAHPTTQQIRGNLERVSAARGSLPAGVPTALAQAPDEDDPAEIEAPFELLLPPGERPPAPAPRVLTGPAGEALPEPAVGEAAALAAPPIAAPPAAPDASAPDVEVEVETEAETELALLVPRPLVRPSGRRWATLPAGRYAIHLASVRSPSSATAEWDRLRGLLELPVEISQLEPERIEVAGQGVFYRVLAGPFASEAEAIAACRRIRAKGDYCVVMGNSD